MNPPANQTVLPLPPSRENFPLPPKRELNPKINDHGWKYKREEANHGQSPIDDNDASKRSESLSERQGETTRRGRGRPPNRKYELPETVKNVNRTKAEQDGDNQAFQDYVGSLEMSKPGQATTTESYKKFKDFYEDRTATIRRQMDPIQ